MYIHVCMYIYIYIHMCVYIYIYIYVYTIICIGVCICVYIYIYVLLLFLWVYCVQVSRSAEGGPVVGEERHRVGARPHAETLVLPTGLSSNRTIQSASSCQGDAPVSLLS